MTAGATMTCPGCGEAVAAAASEGLCPGCLLGGVLARGDMAGMAPEDPVTLRRCGDYEILGVIARGGMGVVFRARQAGLSREVALKMIAAADLAAPDEVRRFRLEAEVIARLDHTNIVPVHAVGEHDGRPFFVMKLAERSLADRLGAGESNPGAAAWVGLMVKVARAVQFAHDRGVLHRDLKPANVLLDGAGEPLVSDFGLARLAHGPGGSTFTGAALGTPGYMPPEQAQGADAVTTASDVYSLGAIFYHLLTGRPPFAGDSALEVLRRAETEEPVNPRLLNLQVDRDLATVCLKCLEKNPARRYPSAAAFADDLERWQRGEAVVARPATWLERLWKWSKRRPAVASLAGAGVAGAAVLAAVLAGGNVMLRRERNLARVAETAAKAGTARAEASEQAMRQNVYASDIFLTRRALDDGHLGVARQTLNRHVPRAGEPDLRGFEWYAFQRLCEGDDLRALTTHEGAVLCVAHDPAGSLAATGGRDGKLRIVRVADGSLVKQLPDQLAQSKIAELAALAALPVRSPETTSLLAGGVTVEEMRMRARPSSLGEISAVAWSPDGAWMVSGGDGGYVRLWKTADWSYQGFIPIKNGVQVAFTPDSARIVVALTGKAGLRTGGEVRVYTRDTLTRTLTLPQVNSCFAVARSVPLLAVNEGGGQVSVRDVLTGKPVYSWHAGSDIFAMAFSPDGSRLAAVHRGTGSFWDVSDGRMVAGFSRDNEYYRAVAYSPDGQWFAAGGSGHVVRLFDGRTGAPLSVLRGHDDEVLALDFSGDGEHLLSGSNDHSSRQWSVVSRHQRDTVLPDNGALTAASPDGSRLLTMQDGRVRCLEVHTKNTALTPGDAMRRGLAFDSEGHRFATLCDETGALEWWNPDGTPSGTAAALAFKTGMPLAVSPAGGWVAFSGPKREPVTLCQWTTGAVLRVLPDAPVKIVRLLSSPDGRLIAALGWPRTLTIFDLAAGTWGPPVKLSEGIVGPVVISPDNTLLASGGDDNLVTVRDLATGRVLASLRGHMAEVKSLAFAPDGRTLASSSSDLTIRLWHVPTWRELGPLHRGSLCPTLLFTPAGLFAEEYQSQILIFESRK